MSFCIHQALSLVMLNFAPACHRCLSNTDSIVCRLFSLCSLLLNLCTSMKNHSRMLLSFSLGISSSLRGSSGHLLHTSNQFTHILDVLLFMFFLQITSDHSKSGAQLISVQCFVPNFHNKCFCSFYKHPQASCEFTFSWLSPELKKTV